MRGHYVFYEISLSVFWERSLRVIGEVAKCTLEEISNIIGEVTRDSKRDR